ncbi:MAG: GNAT family N-acetyltransferase [Oscillospiraceae bacterium]|nr:GNAT family N-acetyltransferase [Oscillospiraceae bacterium]
MNIRIKLTDLNDLRNVQALWASPAVMHFVGFPEGLHESMEALENNWLPWVQQPSLRRHYSVYAEEIGYCGEAFYDVDEEGLACMDIKLLPAARGKGIAALALSHALDEAFLIGGAKRAWVDPNPENAAALRLYARLGFRETARATHLEDPGCPYVYMEVSREDWQARRGVRYRDIVLRDPVAVDIEDEIRWNTVETAWMDWDGPDLQPDTPFDEAVCRAKFLEAIKHPPVGFRRGFELDTAEGRHIGTVSSYATGPNFQHMSWKEAEATGERWHTLGLSICESDLWNRGLGTQALTAFCLHHLGHGITDLRLQTWSGNIRMVRCAEKVGFREVNRFIGNRHIRGGVYDGLTFSLDRAAFEQYRREQEKCAVWDFKLSAEPMTFLARSKENA